MTQEELNEIIAKHKLWLDGKGGERANLTGANLTGANLTGAKGVVTFGPIGSALRIGYAVAHDKTAMVLLGCFWGTRKEALDAIRQKYGPRSAYAALVSAACRAVMENTQ